MMALNYYDVPNGNSSQKMTPFLDRNNSNNWQPMWSSVRAPLMPSQSYSRLPARESLIPTPYGSHTSVTAPSTPLKAPPSSPVPGSPPEVPLSSTNAMCVSPVFNLLPLYLEQYTRERSFRSSISSDVMTSKQIEDLRPFLTDSDEGLDNSSNDYLYMASPSPLRWQSSNSRNNAVDLSSASPLHGSTLQEYQSDFRRTTFGSIHNNVSTSG